jgi:hypothetical protein
MIWGIIIALAAVCGLMGAWSGAGADKIWRRAGIPLLIAMFAFFILWNGWVILIMLMGAVFSLGYGIPTPPNDPGSPIGAFWYKVFNGNAVLATAFTRATIGIFLGLSVFIIPILTGHWILYAVIFALIVFNQVLWTVLITGLGQFPFLGKMLDWEEFFLYACDAFLVMALVIL